MSSYNFNYYGWRELLVCCLVCGDKICNRGYWCEVLLKQNDSMDKYRKIW